jgi:MFS family permease
MSFNAGWAFGPATAGLLAQKSFTLLFLGDAATSVLYGLVAWFALPSGLRGTRAAGSLIETFRVLRDDKRLRQVVLSCLVIGVVFVQAFSTMSLEITRSGFSASTYGLVISFNGLLVVLCELPLTSLTKHYPPRRMIAFGFLLIGLGFASNLLPRALPLLIMTTCIFTFGEMISMPVTGAYVADLAPENRRGLYMGTYGMVWATAFVFGPTLGLSLFAVNRVALWVICGVFGALAAAIISRQPDVLSAPSQGTRSATENVQLSTG